MALTQEMIVGGVIGAIGIVTAVNQARTKGRVDALEAWKQEAEAWRIRSETTKAENEELKKKVAEQNDDIRELRSMVMLDKIPPALQQIFDTFAKTLDELRETVTVVRKLVESATGDIDVR